MVGGMGWFQGEWMGNKLKAEGSLKGQMLGGYGQGSSNHSEP